MTTPEANAALARRYLADVVAADDRSASESFLATDAAIHDPVFGGGRGRGSPSAYGDVEVDVRDLVAAGDRVAVRGVVRGSARSGPDGVPDDGGRFTVAQSWFCRVEHGRIIELWRLPDGLGLARQLGILPEPTFGRDGHDTEADSDP